MENLLVSIIISAYNAEKFLEDTLQSVLGQTWPHCEIIVVDDGSTDSTSDILEEYRSKGVNVLKQENKGQDVALNLGFKHAKGNYIKFLDSDDLINPEMIEIQMNTLMGSSDFVAYSEWARFYNNKPELADFTPLDYWKDMAPIDFITSRPEGVMLQCGLMLIPKSIIEKSGLWDERLSLFNDTEFFNRVILASKGIKFSFGAKLYYRSGQLKSISSQRSKKFFESTFLATKLIGKQLLSVEDSYRVRNMISNMFQYRYYDMYPHFPDLGMKHEEMIKHYGHVTIKPKGGFVLSILIKCLGWKKAKSIQATFYALGYLYLFRLLKRRT